MRKQIVVLLFMVLPSIALQADGFIGIGYGYQYGMAGVQAEYQFEPPLGISAGAGYNHIAEKVNFSAGLLYNIELKGIGHLRPGVVAANVGTIKEESYIPFIPDVNENFLGILANIGYQVGLSEQVYLSFDIGYVVFDDKYYGRIDEINDTGFYDDIDKPIPLRWSVGFKFNVK